MLKVRTLKETKIDVAYITDNLQIYTIEQIIKNQASGHFFTHIKDYELAELKGFVTEYKKGAHFLVCTYKIAAQSWDSRYILKRGTKEQCKRHKRYIQRLRRFDYTFANYKDLIIVVITIITAILAATLIISITP